MNETITTQCDLIIFAMFLLIQICLCNLAILTLIMVFLAKSKFNNPGWRTRQNG